MEWLEIWFGSGRFCMGNSIPYDFCRKRLDCHAFFCISSGVHFAQGVSRPFITEDGEAIEGEALDDVTVIGVVTFTICDVRQDNAVV
ncbi:TPA: hypothetical protein MIT52_08340 [Klebsiella quasipneumoniae]|nr:hypothetical protein [Klebsiella quasipneumoniae]